jgi:transposase-like protein
VAVSGDREAVVGRLGRVRTLPLFRRRDTQVICSTNAIESVNARIRRVVRARGHFPNEAAALKCIYMALMSLDPTGKGRKRWTMRWKAPLNAFQIAFQIAFEGRLTPSNN